MLFESPDLRLDELLKNVGAGELQLPDFQRDFTWDDSRVVSLLASIFRGYAIGVVMTVEAGGDGSRIKCRPLKGTLPSADQRQPTMMLIDGQQRFTSLYQALVSGAPVKTTDPRGQDIYRWYYVDIVEALADESNRESAGSRQT